MARLKGFIVRLLGIPAARTWRLVERPTASRPTAAAVCKYRPVPSCHVALFGSLRRRTEWLQICWRPANPNKTVRQAVASPVCDSNSGYTGTLHTMQVDPLNKMGFFSAHANRWIFLRPSQRKVCFSNRKFQSSNCQLQNQ